MTTAPTSGLAPRGGRQGAVHGGRLGSAEAGGIEDLCVGLIPGVVELGPGGRMLNAHLPSAASIRTAESAKSHRKGFICVSFLPSEPRWLRGVYDSAIPRHRQGAAVTAVRASLIQTLTVGTGVPP